jgi:hypothetical protein
VNFGLGYGLTPASDRFVVKTIVGYAFPVPGGKFRFQQACYRVWTCQSNVAIRRAACPAITTTTRSLVSSIPAMRTLERRPRLTARTLMTDRLHYGTTAKIFHWLIVALLFVQYLIGWLMPDIRRGMKPGDAMTLHISLGS